MMCRRRAGCGSCRRNIRTCCTCCSFRITESPQRCVVPPYSVHDLLHFVYSASFTPCQYPRASQVTEAVALVTAKQLLTPLPHSAS
jgi:hypothetical protein